jgi:hypothetical protein
MKRRAALLGGLLAALALLAAAGVAPAPARADALDGDLAVESAFVTVAGGVYQLHARVRYPANADTQAALRDGVSLSYNLEVEIARERRWWLDAGVTSIALRRTLTYHAVSDRYLVREPGVAAPAGPPGELPGDETGASDSARDRSGQRAFATLDEALEYLGTIEGWPILVTPQVRPDNDYRISVRAGVRRGKLPDALRTIMFWTDQWNRESEWYSWSLPR